MGVRIKGLGVYVPQKRLTNFDLEKMVDTSDEWIRTRTGIQERRIASNDEATSDLAYQAAVQAIQRAQVKPEELDMIIVTTASPDYLFPATACVVQSKLNAQNAACFDVEAACPGFIYGLEIARGFLELPQYRKVLVIGAETLSRLVDWEDRNTCVLFGDGAGAAVLEKDNTDHGIISSYLKGNGALGQLLILPAGGSRRPATQDTVQQREHYIKMQGREVFKYAVTGMQEAALKTLERANIKPEDITWLVPHQANIRIIEATRERLGIPEHKVYVNIAKYGNTSAASIPIALTEMVKEGKIKEGDLVLLVSFGAGFIYGGMLIKW